MIYLHKILPFFVMPLGLCLILVVGGIVFRRRRFCVLGLALLLISSMPVTSDFLMRTVEGWKVGLPAEDMPHADAIVVLSSGMVMPVPGDPPVIEWNDPDRFYGGIELYRAEKAPVIIFTGGWVPWAPEQEPEGRVLSRYAVNMGVPRENILITEKVSNTAAEAAVVADMIKKHKGEADKPRILLVTSAYHMRRSVMLFERAGLEVIPYYVDFQVAVGKKWSVLDFIPQGGSLKQTEMALREVYGYLYYLCKKITGAGHEANG